MSYPASSYKTWTAGEILTAADLNNAFTTTNNVNIPEDIDDYSANDAEMQTTADPYPAGVTSLATSLSDELTRIRYQIHQIGKAIGDSSTFTHWYFDMPDPTAATTFLKVNNSAADGDPGVQFLLSGTASYTLGVDDSDSDALCLTAASTLNGSNILRILGTTSAALTVGAITNSKATVGSATSIDLTNSDNTNAASHALVSITAGGTSGGDAKIQFTVTGGTTYSLGIDNSASDALVLSNGTALGTTDLLSVSSSGDLALSRSSSGGTVLSSIINTSNTANSQARLLEQVAGTSAGDSFVTFAISGGNAWSIGLDNSDADRLKISYSSALGTSDLIQADTDGTYFGPASAGAINSGNATFYWNDISYKTLTDRGCLGWFDVGVELQDGTVVSDCESIAAIKKHPTKKTIYGVDMMDYRTFPKVAYKPADIKGNLLPRDKHNEPIGGQDGIEMTAMQSIMLGAIKELHNRLKKVEDK